MHPVRSSLYVAALSAALALTGCGGAEGPAPSAREEASAAASPAEGSGDSHAKGVVPGSYADWCDEHEVPETACTRCDASLIAAFKATGDWCEEHGLPKSQCRSCDPRLVIARPPKPEGVQ